MRPQHMSQCKKCFSCTGVGIKLVNLMMMGTGINNKWWHDSGWDDKPFKPELRIKAYLPPILAEASYYKRVVISINSYLWDLYADDYVRFEDGSYTEASSHLNMINTPQAP